MRAGVAALRAMILGPFWPLAAMSGMAWALLVAVDRKIVFPDVCAAAGLDWVRLPGRLAAAVHASSPAASIAASLLMLLAMMLPLISPVVHHVWTRSLAERRRRAVVLMLTGYLGVWLGACTVLTITSIAARSASGWDDASMLCATAGVALIWQGTAAKRRLLNRCHTFPTLAVFGAAAEIGSVRLGAVVAGRCVGSCWALMALPFLAGGAHLLCMAAVSMWMLGERFATPRAPRTDLRLLAAGGGAIVTSLAVTWI